MKEIFELPVGSYGDEDAMNRLLQKMGKKSDGQHAVYLMDHIPGTNEGFDDSTVFACFDPFTIDDVEAYFNGE